MGVAVDAAPEQTGVVHNAASDDERAVPGVGIDSDTRKLRDVAADRRERAADQRDSAADRRDSAADQREGIANARESLADARERQLADWETRLDRRDRQVGGYAIGEQDRGHEAIARARALLTASIARLDRSEATLRRMERSEDREQLSVDREIAASALALASAQDNESSAAALTLTAKRLRRRLVAIALDLAEVVDLAAEQHERLVDEDSGDPAEHRRLADDARADAARARAIAREVSGREEPDTYASS